MTNETEIRIALIVGQSGKRKSLKSALEAYGFQIVHEAGNPNTHSSQMRRMRLPPHVMLINTGDPDTFPYELDPTAAKIHKVIPRMAVVFRTELPSDHSFVTQALQAGNSVIDQSIDYGRLAPVIRRIAGGEIICWYASRSYDLDTYARSPRRL